jgi:hypothetical protein
MSSDSGGISRALKENGRSQGRERRLLSSSAEIANGIGLPKYSYLFKH